MRSLKGHSELERVGRGDVGLESHGSRIEFVRQPIDPLQSQDQPPHSVDGLKDWNLSRGTDSDGEAVGFRTTSTALDSKGQG